MVNEKWQPMFVRLRVLHDSGYVIKDVDGEPFKSGDPRHPDIVVRNYPLDALDTLIAWLREAEETLHVEGRAG